MFNMFMNKFTHTFIFNALFNNFILSNERELIGQILLIYIFQNISELFSIISPFEVYFYFFCHVAFTPLVVYLF